MRHPFPSTRHPITFWTSAST